MNNELCRWRGIGQNTKHWMKFGVFHTIKCIFVNHLNPAMYYRDAKYVLQRGFRGYADCDLWSLDNYFAKVIPDAVEHLKHNLHSYPPILTNPDGTVLYNTWPTDETEPSIKFDKLPHELWEEQLDKIINGFRVWAALDEEDPNLHLMTREHLKKYWDDKQQQTLNAKEDMKLFIHHFGDLWD